MISIVVHHRSPIVAVITALCACAHPLPVRAPAAASEHNVDIAAARAGGAVQRFTWEKWSPEVFARAAREHRFILVDGSAEWCHWCHVMDETTYRDALVGDQLRGRFVAIRVDIDERPDLAERYGDWGWPATILLSPDAEELGKFRGYLPPERLREILSETIAGGTAAKASSPVIAPPPRVEALPWIAALALHEMDRFYDDEHGGWGFRIKAPIGDNVVFELRRAAHGDAAAGARAQLTLDKQRAILDPVWGGIYQDSAGGDWNDPHFEKLMPYQARNLEAYARGYAHSHAPAVLEAARGIAGYLDRFLSAPDGGFYTNQDADVGAHDRQRFVDGHVYYRRDDAGRRALGMPWIDTHVYARENGMAITALVALAEVTGDAAPLARARRAAERILRTHVGAEGEVWHDGDRREGPLFLTDHAELGLAFVRLAEATGDAAWVTRARAIATRMETSFLNPETGAYWDETADKNAVGVFARRRQPLEDNVAAARFLAALARITHDATQKARAERTLVATLLPDALEHEGFWLGVVLLALDDIGAVPWPTAQVSG
jgi:uncharacterized protein YyaL (SSP411 family)